MVSAERRPIVLVPGACLGGWAWRDVAARLRAHEHDAYSVTLTGLGDRVHLARADVDLETHIADVVNLLDFEGLEATLEAAVLLDDKHPGVTPAALPYLRAAPGATGVFQAPAGIMRGGHTGSNNLAAERLLGAWLVIAGGSGPAEQLELLRHLHATIHL